MIRGFAFVRVLVAVLTLIGKTSAQGSPKYVVAHFLVGNTYPFTVADWTNNINIAMSKGIDGFALNVGRDDWQPARVADAYRAVSAIGPSFKLFLSLDMGSLPCQTNADGNILRNYVNTYYDHQNQMIYNGKVLVSSFGGQGCRFGAADVNQGWRNVLKTGLPDVHFVPSFFMDPAIYGSIDTADGAFSWDSAWPMGNHNISSDYDIEHRKYLNGRTYMAGVSPWFFTHYGRDTYNKNFIFRGDDWLLSERWEILIRDRDTIDMIEVISWNDYGESHYMGPIAGAQPNSQSWTEGFDHQGWLDLQQYYIAAYKTGTYPQITKDRIFMWGRLYPAKAQSPDPLDMPLNHDYTDDVLWAVLLLTAPGQLKLSCGDSNLSIDLPGGLSKTRIQLTQDCTPTAVLSRNGSPSLTYSPLGFNFKVDPPMYNFNAFVGASQ